MEKGDLANFAALHVLNHFPLDLKILQREVTPHRRFPFVTHGVAAPDFGLVKTAATDHYLNLWQFNVGESLARWVEIYHYMYQTCGIRLHLLPVWDNFHYLLRQHLPVHLQTYKKYYLPSVVLHNNPTGLRSTSVMESVDDYVQRTGATPLTFSLFLFQLVLFGFPTDTTSATCLGVENNVQTLIEQCLKQGRVDSVLLRTFHGKSATSYFDVRRKKYRPLSATDDDYVGKKIGHYLHSTKGVFAQQKTLPGVGKDLLHTLERGSTLGGHREALAGIAKLGGFSTLPRYSHYLARNFASNIEHYTPDEFEQA